MPIVSAADREDLAAAYRHQSAGDLTNAVASFTAYLREHPNDWQASLDLAGLWSGMGRHEEAAAELERLAALYPDNETIAFKHAVARTVLRQFDRAQELFSNLQQSNRPEMREAADAALAQLQRDRNRLARRQAEDRIYDLVRDLKYEEALDAMSELETQRELSFVMAMQRLYALFNLGRFDEALTKAQALSPQHPNQVDLRFLRAELLVQLGRHPEAQNIWRQVEEDFPGTFAADEAFRRRTQTRIPAPESAEEQRIYRMAEAGRHSEVLQAVDAMEVRQGVVPFTMEMQRLYALYNLEQYSVARAEADLLAESHPHAVDLAMLRAELLMQLDQAKEAEAIWEQIQQELPGSAAAQEAQRRQAALPKTNSITLQEERIYALAAENKPEEVIRAVDALQQDYLPQPLPLPMDLQRLYAFTALDRHEEAWPHAERLWLQHSNNVDVAFLAAEILLQRDQPDQAVAIWEHVATTHPNTPDAEEANRRLEAMKDPNPLSPEEKRIFELANEQQHAEVIAAIDDLERSQGRLALAMELQRLYALMGHGQIDRALAEAERMESRTNAPPSISFIRSELLVGQEKWEEASLVLRGIKRRYPKQAWHHEANRRLADLPQVANLDRWHWGEAYWSGDYLGRYDTIVGSGFVRYGTFVPHLRSLQPYAEFRYVGDTESDPTGPRASIISDNFVGHYAGLRWQLFTREYLFLFFQGGVTRDLLDQRDDGDYALDYQAGIYGYKPWGPGMSLRTPTPEDFPFSRQDGASTMVQTNGFFWRGDWFADASLNFTYYHRYASWLGYAQARQGIRLFQIGPRIAFDAYVGETLAWDVAGNYFDNFLEGGPGLRWLWTPCPQAQVVLRAEWHYGRYLGRDVLNQSSNADSTYDEIVAGLSVGMRW